MAGWTCSGFGPVFLQRVLANCVAVGGMYSGFVAPLNVPHDHSYLDGDSPPAAAFQHSISKASPSWGTSHWAIAALLQAEYIPPPLKSGYPHLEQFYVLAQTERRDCAIPPSPKVAAFHLDSQHEPSPSAADVPNRRGYLFRLQACSDRPQGCVPRISPLARRCQNDAAGGEVTSKAGVPWDTFNGTPKPK